MLKLLALALLTPALAAQAPYLDQQPEHVNDNLTFSDVATYDPIWFTEQHIAEQFTVAADTKLVPQKLVWWGGHYQATFTGADQFVVEIRADDGQGAPGVLMHAHAGPQPTATKTGYVPPVFYPWDEIRYDLPLSGTSELPPGDYHVVIYNDTTFTSDGLWGWVAAQNDTTTGLPGFAYSDSAGGQWWQGLGRGMALEVWGDVILPLSADVDSLSIFASGSQTFSLDAGTARAGDLYFVVGSFSGTSPGFDFGSVHLPLNLDSYMLYTIANPNTPIHQLSFGTLDGNGKAASFLSLPFGLDPGFIGLTGAHAFVALDPITLAPTFASNAVTVDILP